MFVEVSPHPVLAATVDDTVGADSVALSTLRRGEGGADRFRSALCEAGAHGAPVDWTPLFSGAQRVDLPTYPFQGRRFWLAPPVTGTDASALGLSVAGHPLLGATVDIADEDTTVLTGVLSLQAQPWLADHAVLGTVLVPGAALVELALHTGDRLGYGRVDEMTLEAPLVLPGDGSVQLQLVAGAADGDGRPLTVHSRAADGPWTRHAAGRLTVADEAPAPMTAWPPAGASPVDLTSLYDRLLARGYEYGPAFQGARAGWQLGDDTFIEVALAEEQQDEAGTFGVHPALLDALLHPAVRAAAGEAGGPRCCPSPGAVSPGTAEDLPSCACGCPQPGRTPSPSPPTTPRAHLSSVWRRCPCGRSARLPPDRRCTRWTGRRSRRTGRGLTSRCAGSTGRTRMTWSAACWT